MLFDLGWSELLLIGVVALVFIGPKDLPKALRVAGFWVRKARTLSREFQSSVDQMIREAELDEMRQELKKATEIDLEKEFRETVDPKGELAESLKPPELPDLSEPVKSPATAAGNGAAPPPDGETTGLPTPAAGAETLQPTPADAASPSPEAGNGAHMTEPIPADAAVASPPPQAGNGALPPKP
jgi:sec-independent protein translocase protein TatB